MNKGAFLNFIRGSVRPAIVMTGWIGWLFLVYTGHPYPSSLEMAVLGYTAWYFKDRHTENKNA